MFNKLKFTKNVKIALIVFSLFIFYILASKIYFNLLLNDNGYIKKEDDKFTHITVEQQNGKDVLISITEYEIGENNDGETAILKNALPSTKSGHFTQKFDNEILPGNQIPAYKEFFYKLGEVNRGISGNSTDTLFSGRTVSDASSSSVPVYYFDKIYIYKEMLIMEKDNEVIMFKSTSGTGLEDQIKTLDAKIESGTYSIGKNESYDSNEDEDNIPDDNSKSEVDYPDEYVKLISEYSQIQQEFNSYFSKMLDMPESLSSNLEGIQSAIDDYDISNQDLLGNYDCENNNSDKSRATCFAIDKNRESFNLLNTYDSLYKKSADIQARLNSIAYEIKPIIGDNDILYKEFEIVKNNIPGDLSMLNSDIQSKKSNYESLIQSYPALDLDKTKN